MKHSCAILVSLGILLMSAAFLYPLMFGAESNWSESQAQELLEVGSKAHSIGHAHKHGSATSGESEKTSAEIMAEYRRIEDELAAARERPRQVAWGLKWLGVACTVLGVGLYYSTYSRA